MGEGGVLGDSVVTKIRDTRLDYFFIGNDFLPHLGVYVWPIYNVLLSSSTILLI